MVREVFTTEYPGSIRRFVRAITGSNTLTVRQWLSTQSFDAQAAFGRRAIENVGAGRW